MPSSLNGTGVTFNDGTTLQSGNIPSANLGSGTANSTTFLRGDRTFATPPSQAPTTAQVGTATAGLALNALGTYALAISSGNINQSTTRTNPGGTIAGSSLRYTGLAGTQGAFISESGTGLTGTWRCMGFERNRFVDSASKVITVWLRIS